jgi:nucleoside-diphosphate-sugar epimerase
MTRVLVLGATGHLGAEIVESCERRGIDVVGAGYARTTSVQASLNIVDPQAVEEALQRGGFGVVVNASGIGVVPGSASLADMIRVNSLGPTVLARAMGSVDGSPHLVHLASASEPRLHGEAESSYAATKALGRLALLEEYGGRLGKLTVLRVHNTYSGRQRTGQFLTDLISAARRNTCFHIRFPERVRDFALATEAADRIVEACLGQAGDRIRQLDVGTGRGVALRAVAELVFNSLGAEPANLTWASDGTSDPNPIAVAGADGAEIALCPTELEAGLKSILESGS